MGGLQHVHERAVGLLQTAASVIAAQSIYLPWTEKVK